MSWALQGDRALSLSAYPTGCFCCCLRPLPTIDRPKTRLLNWATSREFQGGQPAGRSRCSSWRRIVSSERYERHGNAPQGAAQADKQGPCTDPTLDCIADYNACWYAKTENGVHGRTWWYSLPGLLISEEIWLLRQPQRVIKAWGGLIGVKFAALGSWLRHVQLGGKLRYGVCSTCQPDECSAAAEGGGGGCSCVSSCKVGSAEQQDMPRSPEGQQGEGGCPLATALSVMRCPSGLGKVPTHMQTSASPHGNCPACAKQQSMPEFGDSSPVCHHPTKQLEGTAPRQDKVTLVCLRWVPVCPAHHCGAHNVSCLDLTAIPEGSPTLLPAPRLTATSSQMAASPPPSGGARRCR